MSSSLLPSTPQIDGNALRHGNYRPLPALPDNWHSLAHAFLEQVRCRPTATAICDVTGASLRYDELLLKATVLGRYLSPMLGPDKYVGIMLPPTVPAAVANLAIVLLGKIAVNLNYTTGQAIVDSSITQCEIRTVLTSEKVTERFKIMPKAENVVLLDQVPARIRLTHKLAGSLLAGIARIRAFQAILHGLRRPDLDSVATVIFTSGSTGDPKGVVLSQRNILHNVHQVNEHIQLLPNEVLLGILPFFHSFGYTVTLWTALTLGKKVVYHFNPLDAKTIGKLCEQHDVTLIAGTPSFTRFYIKNCPPKQFKALKHLILGAEKLKPELYRDINQWLGIEPMEGYGTTELSPVVAANLPREIELPDGRRIYGNRPGTVGLPVPGTEIKTIDPETGADLPPGVEGLVCVKGPQVMQGYLNRPEATNAVLNDGWYSTGDLGYVDPDGFLKITDRLSRFSKIAGEMVPHVGVETAIMEVAGVTEQNVAVTGLPDAKHGERLCVLYTDLGMTPDEVHKRLIAAPLPRLWIPSVHAFIEVSEIPITGTGKVDLRGLKELAIKVTAT